MIPNNLKVGDTFIDGTGKYEITGIDALGRYESKRLAFVESNSALKSEPPVKTDEKPLLDSFNQYTRTEINRLNNTELEKVCDKLGLEKSTGIVMKKAIIDHLGL